jgi:tetratricopeptide (TPR) repeat protein
LNNLSAQAKQVFDEGLLLSNDPDTCEQAASKFREVIQLYPDYARAYFELGRMYYRWSHYEKAFQPLQKAIELQPDEPASYYNLGKAYNRAGFYGEAEKHLNDFVQLRPDHAEAFYELGFATLMQFGKDKEAIEHFREAIRLYPRHSEAYYFLGSALLRMRDLVGARELVDQLNGIYPKQAEHLSHRIDEISPSR